MTLDRGEDNQIPWDQRQSEHELRNILQWLDACSPQLRDMGRCTLDAIYTDGAVRGADRLTPLRDSLINNLQYDKRLHSAGGSSCRARDGGADGRGMWGNVEAHTGELIDETVVLQVVLNLEHNAIRHGGGHLFTRLERVELPGGSYLSIAVGDRGCPPQREAGIHTSGGEGLGVRIVRELLALHEGWLTYMTRSTYAHVLGDSEQVSGHVAVGVVRIVTQTRETPQRRIVCVDDNRFAREAVKAVLKKAGYRVDLADTSAEAIAAAERHYYSHALIDARLGSEDGLGLAAKITPLVGRVTILSGDAPSTHWLGPWLRKPVSADRLVEALDERYTVALCDVGAVCHLTAVMRDSRTRYDSARYIHTLARWYRSADLEGAVRRLINGDVDISDIEQCLRWHIHRAGERRLAAVSGPAQ